MKNMYETINKIVITAEYLLGILDRFSISTSFKMSFDLYATKSSPSPSIVNLQN